MKKIDRTDRTRRLLAWWRRKSVTGMWESTVRGGAWGESRVVLTFGGWGRGEWNRSQKAKVQKGR